MGQRGQYSGEVFGEVRLQDLIARGGMGEIYRGHHEVLDIGVAIKVILPNQGTDNEFKERFLREARASLQLTHPNILRVFTAAKKEAVYYIIMEYIDGTDVKQILKMHKRIDWRYSVNIVKQTCDGLSYAHKQGVIHRDIKPDNIMLTRKGLVKIADFGLATMKSAQSSLTTTGQVLGTPLFMSPEQCKGVKADNRADIYSLGITWYNMLVGRPPFIGESPAAVIGQHLQRPPHYPEGIFKKVPNHLKTIIDGMLAKDREKRYQNLDDVLQEISKLSQEFTKKIGQNDVKKVVQEIQYKKTKRPISSAEIPRVQLEEIEKHAQEAVESLTNGMDVSELDADELLKDDVPEKRLKSNSEIRIQSVSPELAKTKASKEQEQRNTTKVRFNKFDNDQEPLFPKLKSKEDQPARPTQNNFAPPKSQAMPKVTTTTVTVGSSKMLTIVIFVSILLLAAGGVLLLPNLLRTDKPQETSTNEPSTWFLCSAVNDRNEVSIYKVSENGKESIQISRSFEEKYSPVYDEETDSVYFFEKTEDGMKLMKQDSKGNELPLIETPDDVRPKENTQLFWCSDTRRLFFVDIMNRLVFIKLSNNDISYKLIQFTSSDVKVPIQYFDIRKNKVALISQSQGTPEKSTIWFSDILDEEITERNASFVNRRLKLMDRIYTTDNKISYPFFNPAGTRISFLEVSRNAEEINSMNLLGKEKSSLYKSNEIDVKGKIIWLEYPNSLLFIGQAKTSDSDQISTRLYKLDLKQIDSIPQPITSPEFVITSFSLMECK